MLFATAVHVESIDDALLTAAGKALPEKISTDEITRTLKSGLWNPDKTAIAIALNGPKSSLIYVFLRQADGDYIAVDVSRVESANFGKLGTGRTLYEKFETVPTECLHRDDGLFQVVMRTRAWSAGQRYTVSEPLVIRADGTPLWR